MVDECASCEADDELLFTCTHCEKKFCSAHQFPFHGCEGFGRAANAGASADEWMPASASEGASAGGSVVDSTDTVDSTEAPESTDVTEPPESSDPADRETTAPTGPTAADTAAGEESVRSVTVSPAQPSSRAESISGGSWGTDDGLPPGAGDGVVNVRPMDSARIGGGTEASAAPRTVGDWISRQTYLTLFVKVGIISLLVNSAFYGGMAVTLYGLLPFVL